MNANTIPRRLDPRSVTPVQRTYLRARMLAHEPRSPRLVAAAVALACGGLLLLL